MCFLRKKGRLIHILLKILAGIQIRRHKDSRNKTTAHYVRNTSLPVGDVGQVTAPSACPALTHTLSAHNGTGSVPFFLIIAQFLLLVFRELAYLAADFVVIIVKINYIDDFVGKQREWRIKILSILCQIIVNDIDSPFHGSSYLVRGITRGYYLFDIIGLAVKPVRAVKFRPVFFSEFHVNKQLDSPQI